MYPPPKFKVIFPKQESWDLEKPARTSGTLALAKNVSYVDDPNHGPCVNHLQSVYSKPGSLSSEDGMLHRRGGGGWQNRGV